VGVPESRPFRFSTLLSVFERNSSPETSNHLSIMPPGIGPTGDESAALSPLKDLIEVGDRPLDSILMTIADTAGQLTGASGVALAMWKDGAMVCRARSGDAAPPLGSELTASAGISGECLTTGKIQHCADTENAAVVDMDVCRTFGLRSIVALPIRGWRGVNGILEVFSTQPEAFGEQHLVILEELAALAERARALQPQDASPPETQAFG
jgi:diguanylate cyclase